MWVAVPTPVNRDRLDTKLAAEVAGALHKIDDTAPHVDPVARVAFLVAFLVEEVA